jgi:hypothetical protein
MCSPHAHRPAMAAQHDRDRTRTTARADPGTRTCPSVGCSRRPLRSARRMGHRGGAHAWRHEQLRLHPWTDYSSSSPTRSRRLREAPSPSWGAVPWSSHGWWQGRSSASQTLGSSSSTPPTTVVTLLMVLLIHNAQNRDGVALQTKLDELIRWSDDQDEGVGLENSPTKNRPHCTNAARPPPSGETPRWSELRPSLAGVNMPRASQPPVDST